MLEVSSGMKDFKSKRQSQRHTKLATLERMHAVLAMTSMYMFMEELEPIFVVKNQL